MTVRRRISATFTTRESATYMPRQDVDLRVMRYSRAARWGARDATIRAEGPEVELLRWLKNLMYRVSFSDWNGRRVWHGIVTSVTVYVDSLAITADLTTMFNRVQVTYSSRGQASATTDWAEDASSYALYHAYIEKRESAQGATTGQAEAQRDRFLADHAKPSLQIRSNQAVDKPYAEITCSGRQVALAWRHYQRENTNITFDAKGTSDYIWGDDSARQKIGQTWSVSGVSGTSLNVARVHVKLAKVNDPGADITLRICANNAGQAGTSLGAVTLANADIDTSLTDYEILEFAQPYPEIAIGGTYWTTIERSNAVNASKYFVVKEVTGNQYADGGMYTYNGATWSAVSGSDFKFKIEFQRETTGQMADILKDVGTPVLSGLAKIDQASGIYTSPDRDGNTSGLAEIEDMLDAGWMAGQDALARRLLTDVQDTGLVRIYAEPAIGEANDYILTSKNEMIYPRTNKQVPPQLCMCGVWARARGVLPPGMDFSELLNPGATFIESAEYDVESNTVSYTPRDERSLSGIVRLDL